MEKSLYNSDEGERESFSRICKSSQFKRIDSFCGRKKKQTKIEALKEKDTMKLHNCPCYFTSYLHRYFTDQIKNKKTTTFMIFI